MSTTIINVTHNSLLTHTNSFGKKETKQKNPQTTTKNVHITDMISYSSFEVTRDMSLTSEELVCVPTL